ncbi:hypothetical protein BFJ63_vAg18687 [Fusarium oxysporum f. sp. narcissi]|uniref:Uncharacterized protein n=1 Tax=Fusarium oxysporum f. sp. narcissi TaxID=451672 RepID=A0A4Q2V1G4_FUSOX|nr:hypothetical protein BFJ63_vAg18687 [Fusarium oxysporum f. sp. narcissi]
MDAFHGHHDGAYRLPECSGSNPSSGGSEIELTTLNQPPSLGNSFPESSSHLNDQISISSRQPLSPDPTISVEYSYNKRDLG